MMGITKYFHKRKDNQKKFLYNEDYDFLHNELERKEIKITKSIDAEIMDLSDEIAYAAHDLEDALSFNMISLGEIVHEFKISDEYHSAYGKMAEKEAMQANKFGSSEEYSMILKKELTSIIVNTLCRDIGLVNGKLGYKRNASLAKGLKKLLFKSILRKRDIQLYEKRGRKYYVGYLRFIQMKSTTKTIYYYLQNYVFMMSQKNEL